MVGSTFRKVLFLGGLLAVSTPASAQFGPSARFNYQFGLASQMPYNLWLPGLPQVPGRFVYQGYTLSGVGGNGPYTINYGTFRNPAVGGYSSGPGYYQQETLGFGSSSSGSARLADQQRSAIAAAQRAATTEKPKAPNAEDWLRDAAKRRDNPEVAAIAVKAELIDPPLETILNGSVLNDLAGLIRNLEKTKSKAQPGLCAPELLLKLNFEGGAASSALHFFRNPELVYPECLRGNDSASVRKDLNAAFEAVAKEAGAGKQVPLAEVEKLIAAIRKAHDDADGLMKDAPVGQARELCEFFSHLDDAAKYLKSAESVGVAGAKWASLGGTVSDLSQHLAKYKIRIGPCPSGDEAAYYSLHRGLLAYYAGLLQEQAKK